MINDHRLNALAQGIHSLKWSVDGRIALAREDIVQILSPTPLSPPNILTQTFSAADCILPWEGLEAMWFDEVPFEGEAPVPPAEETFTIGETSKSIEPQTVQARRRPTRMDWSPLMQRTGSCMLAIASSEHRAYIYDFTGKLLWNLSEVALKAAGHTPYEWHVEDKNELRRMRYHGLCWSKQCFLPGRRWGTVFLALGNEIGEVSMWSITEDVPHLLMTVALPQNEKVGPWDQGQPGPTWVNSIAWGPWVPTSKDTFTALVAALTDNGGVYLITMKLSHDGKLTKDPNIVTASPPNPRKPTQITWWHADECADTGMCVLASTSVGKITVYFCNVLEGTMSVVEHLWEGYALATDMCFTPDANPLLHVMTSLGNAIVLKILPGTQSVDVSPSLTSRLKAHLEARRKAFAVGDDQINANIRIWGATLSPGGGCLAYAYENVASKTIRYVTNVEAAMRIGFFPTQEGAEYMAGMKALALDGLRSAVMNVYRQSLRGMLWDPTVIFASILKTNGSDAADEFLEQAWRAIDAASAFDSDADVTGHAIDHQLAISLFQPKFNAMRLVYAWWQGLQGFKNIKHRVFASDLSSVMADLRGHLAVTALHIFTTTCPTMIAPPTEGSLSYRILTLYADFIKQTHSGTAGIPELAANVYQLLGADPSPEHGRESCLACGSGIKWEDPTDAKCDNNHTWSRCALTLTTLQTPRVRTCTGCKKKAMVLDRSTGGEEWAIGMFSALDICPFCGGTF